MRLKLPKIGDEVTVFGLTFIVEHVEPEDDWTWRIEGPLADNRDEKVVVLVPTDFRTTDGLHFRKCEV